MQTQLIEKLRRMLVEDERLVDELARAADVPEFELAGVETTEWNPTARTLIALERFLLSRDRLSPLASTEEIIDEARNGRMFILVDDEDRENEGDLIIPAQMATPDAINFMATHGRGLICLTLTGDRAERLGLEPMSRNNQSRHETAFTVSIEAREGITTGISARDRAQTIAVAIDPERKAEDVVSPGHVFPLISRDGGVLVRAGHTEAAVDIARLAGLNPSGVICEVMRDDGAMARMDDLVAFAHVHDLKIGTIRDLIAYRRRHDHLVERASEATFLSQHGGDWRAIAYRNKIDGSATVALAKGQIVPGKPTLVRMHGVSIYADLLGRPAKQRQGLERAMELISADGAGIVVVLFPTGMENIIREIGTGGERRDDMDLRDYGIGAQVLADLGVRDMVLLTNAHRNVVGIEGYGLRVVGERSLRDA